MLSYALAIAVAISSLILFSTAFLMSKIHRKDDFLWSAVGLFYALILWFCARNITGTVLLGQAAATVLILSYCWQTIKLRKVIANPAQAVEKTNFSVVQSFKGLFRRKKPKFESSAEPIVKPPTSKVTEQEIAIPETPVSTSPQTPVAPIPTTVPVVDQSAKDEQSPKDEQVISDSQPTPEIQPIQNNESNLEQRSPQTPESQSLPNKLPETVAQPEPETTIVSADQADNQIEKAVETEEITDNTSQSKVESTPETVTSEIAQPKSSLDLLETVEVAEVLEAEIDNSTNSQESDQANIIEVTTTDINIMKETKKTDINQANDSDI